MCVCVRADGRIILTQAPRGPVTHGYEGPIDRYENPVDRLSTHHRGSGSSWPRPPSHSLNHTPLNHHTEVRTKSRFVCRVCDKTFTQKGGLLNHSRIHTGERPFQCKMCARSFTQKCNLTRHLKAVHSGEKPFQCWKCGRRFNRKWGLVVHGRVHDDPHEAPMYPLIDMDSY